MAKQSGAKTIRVGNLARVEGEGALELKIKDGRVAKANFSIFESPRFFEAFLRGRRGAEAPDLTARICGICPVAYQLSACNALENACGVAIDDDGPGLAAHQRQAALSRGQRLDETKPGSGLGLSIVSDLAALYGGRLSLDDSPKGGLRAVLILPAA